MPRKFKVKWYRLDVKTFQVLVCSHEEFGYFDPRRIEHIKQLAGDKKTMTSIFRCLPRKAGKRLVRKYGLYGMPPGSLYREKFVNNDRDFTFVVTQIRNVHEGFGISMPATN